MSDTNKSPHAIKQNSFEQIPSDGLLRHTTTNVKPRKTVKSKTLNSLQISDYFKTVNADQLPGLFRTEGVRNIQLKNQNNRKLSNLFATSEESISEVDITDSENDTNKQSEEKLNEDNTNLISNNNCNGPEERDIPIDKTDEDTQKHRKKVKKKKSGETSMNSSREKKKSSTDPNVPKIEKKKKDSSKRQSKMEDKKKGLNLDLNLSSPTTQKRDSKSSKRKSKGGGGFYQSYHQSFHQGISEISEKSTQSNSNIDSLIHMFQPMSPRSIKARLTSSSNHSHHGENEHHNNNNNSNNANASKSVTSSVKAQGTMSSSTDSPKKKKKTKKKDSNFVEGQMKRTKTYHKFSTSPRSSSSKRKSYLGTPNANVDIISPAPSPPLLRKDEKSLSLGHTNTEPLSNFDRRLQKKTNSDENNLKLATLKKCKITSSREAKAHFELTVTEGDTVTLRSMPKSGWVEGEINGKTGYFPINTSSEILSEYPDQIISETPPLNLFGSSLSKSESDFKESLDLDAVEEGAILLFSTKPEKAIALLSQHSIIENTPKSIANYLYKSTRLDREMIGDYLGGPSDFQQECLSYYLDHLNFKELEFDKALRLFLYTFKLPGEAQKISRILEKFASKFYTQYNGSIFESEDTVFILAFSLIMLNTDLHSPSIKKKMTQAEFIHNNRSINNGKDLPSVFLEDLYQRILEDEIKTKVDHAFPKAIKRGYLLLEKKGFSNFSKKTQKYWFVLDKETKGLHYFKLETDTVPIESFHLENITIKRNIIDKKDTLFPIVMNYKEDDGKISEFKLITPSQRLWVDWMTSISDCIRDIKLASNNNNYLKGELSSSSAPQIIVGSGNNNNN